MRIITLITKRSVREIDPERQKKRFFSAREFTIGDVIEIIDGNRKAPAYVYASEDTSAYKQAIRSGDLDLGKIKFSKTGDYADGGVMTKYDPKIFITYLQKPSLAHATEDPFLKNFFPKKRKKKVVKVQPSQPKADSFSSLSINKYFGQEKTHHSEMHELVDTIRKYFGENARYGQGSFSYYIGFFKKIPNHQIRQMFAEAKGAPKSIEGQKKTFWWKCGQYVKNKNK